MLLRLAPVLFVLIWSTGWITARAAAPLADPLTFLAARYALAALALFLIMLAFNVKLPSDRHLWAHGLASGVLLHAIYLGGVWYVIDEGLATPLSGLIAALQPLLTAVLAVTWLAEHLTKKQWLGLVLGFAGLVVALLPRLFALEGESFAAASWLIVINVVAMISVTLGTLYQKRFLQGGDLRAISFLQYIGATLATLPFAFLMEEMHITINGQSLLIMAWSVIGLSLAAIGLLLLLIRHGAVSRAATLIYLIPPLVAIEAWLLFGENLAPIAILGMVITVFGVYLVNKKPS
ncbi:MAG: DMT family transporter [Rhizobiales bacterium]|nr:DMT family transporter [Hyphomicrobiales bacterium]MBO6699733.1 DMT family transporter [Hyphomicrobiales bacterium]MBO6737271.1 DMT family transporter [Hyphomicrobiales bacterium]MBO6911655.1 DMT family transporter [Hyphomicrobiales bacterium]MBO6954923.1 DMT family transporter [Hyphomicrobiales bacterium]